MKFHLILSLLMVSLLTACGGGGGSGSSGPQYRLINGDNVDVTEVQKGVVERFEEKIYEKRDGSPSLIPALEWAFFHEEIPSCADKGVIYWFEKNGEKRYTIARNSVIDLYKIPGKYDEKLEYSRSKSDPAIIEEAKIVIKEAKDYLIAGLEEKKGDSPTKNDKIDLLIKEINDVYRSLKIKVDRNLVYNAAMLPLAKIMLVSPEVVWNLPESAQIEIFCP